MKRARICELAACAAAAGATAGLAYLLAIRPWHVRWGATDDEVRRPMPGDDMVDRPSLAATRAITIRARPDQVWPWLLQLGYGRAGFYSYDWIDNRRIPSADRIVPELQHLEVGDLLPTGPNGGFRVEALEPSRMLLLAIRDERARISFCTLLEELDERRTRMIMRARVAFKSGFPWLLYFLVFDPGDFVMMRKMMLGIRRRAEALAEQKRDDGRGRAA